VTRAATLLVAALVSAGCVRDSEPEPVGRHLVYTQDLAWPKTTIWIGDVDGRRMRRLIGGFNPLVSPDGRRVAFNRCRVASENCRVGLSPGKLYTVSPKGGAPELVSQSFSADGWFPDSKHLLSVDGRIAKLNVDTGKQTVLARPPRQLLGWSISPTGDEVVYAVLGKGVPTHICPFKGDLFVAQADGGGTRPLTAEGRDSDPVWVADAILFAREKRGCRLTPSSGIWTMHPDGTEIRPIVRVAPRRFAWNGYYGLRPHGRVTGASLLLAGVRTEWGDELALHELTRRRVRRPDLDPRPRYGRSMYVDHVSRDGRHVLAAGCGAEAPCTITVFSVLHRRARDIVTGRVGEAHWNR
jgi:hypothetical protein